MITLRAMIDAGLRELKIALTIIVDAVLPIEMPY